jgi:2',3'-cyclic-nucleotide 2'-phosphodiesterase (5'-nucleotidase family)
MLSDPLIVESGNALFRVPSAPGAAELERAAFMLSTMGALGTKVMAVGRRDLIGGVPFLLNAAKEAKVTLVSSTLRSRDGAPIFSPSVVVSHQGSRVAFLATGDSDEAVAAGARSLGAVEALRRELVRLPPRDLTVVFATGGYQEAMTIAEAFSGLVDVVIQSGEYRGTVPPQRVKDVLLLASGDRGRAIALVTLNLGSGRGPFADRNESARDEELLENLNRQVASIDDRVKLTTDAEARRQLAVLARDMKLRRDEQARKVKSRPLSRSLKLEWVILGPEVADDETLQKEVLKREPGDAGVH